MDAMIVLSKPVKNRETKTIEKEVNKRISEPMLFSTLEIEIMLKDPTEIQLKILKEIAEKQEFEMEVIK